MYGIIFLQRKQTNQNQTNQQEQKRGLTDLGNGDDSREDRHKPRQKQHRRVPLERQPQGLAYRIINAKIQQETPDAVSYTHLTLPTIYSV